MAVMKPHRIQLHQRNKHSRDTQPYEYATQRGDAQGVGQTKGQRTDTRNRGADRNDFAYAQGVGHDSYGNLHHGIGVKISRGQRAKRGTAGKEGLLQIGGYRGRRHAMKKSQHVTRHYQRVTGPA